MIEEHYSALLDTVHESLGAGSVRATWQDAERDEG